MDRRRLAGKTRSLFFDPIPESGPQDLGTKKSLGTPNARDTNPHEATGLKVLIVKEMAKNGRNEANAAIVRSINGLQRF